MKSELSILDCFKGKVLVVGIGNTFRGDDGAGPVLIDSLKSKISALPAGGQSPKSVNSSSNRDSRTPACQLLLMNVGEVPENYIQKIVKLAPDTIFFVDAADFGGSAGSTKLIDVKSLDGGGFSTHNSSLELVINYLKAELRKIRIFLLGVQPENLRMGDGLSKAVENTLRDLENLILKCAGW